MKRTILIVYLTLFSFLVIIFCCCKPKAQNDPIRCINITDSVLGYSPLEGAPASINNSNYNIYYYNDLILYRYFYGHSMYLNNDFVSSEQRVCYVVHHIDSLYGWYYDSYPFNETDESKRINIDSIYKKPDSKTYDTLFSYKPDSSYWNTDRSFFYEVYNLNEADPSGSYYLSYSPAMTNIPVSFSAKLDSARKMKLVKIKTVVNEGFSKKYNTVVPGMEQIKKMTEIPVENRKEVLYYFDKYSREHLRK